MASLCMTDCLIKSYIVALILVSDIFLWSRPYLKDSAALIRESDVPSSETNGHANEGLNDICQIGIHT